MFSEPTTANGPRVRGPFLIDRARPAIEIAAAHFGFEPARFFVVGRPKLVARARNALTLALKIGTEWSQAQIARCTRIDQDGSIKRLRRAKRDYENDPDFAALVDRMVAAL